RVYGKLCDCYIRIPNAFSPNDDGLNDIFLPVLEPGCPIKGYDLQIYNLWGQLVFQSPLSAGTATGWDGKYKGHAAEAGTYMYRLWIEAGTESRVQERKGSVVLIR